MEEKEEELEAVNGQGLLPSKVAQGEVVTSKEPTDDIKLAEVVGNGAPNSAHEEVVTNDVPEVAQAGGATHEALEDTHDDVVMSEPLKDGYDKIPTKEVQSVTQQEDEYAEQPFPPSGAQSTPETRENLELQDMNTEALAASGGSKERIIAHIADPPEVEEEKGVKKAKKEEEEKELNAGEEGKEEEEGEEEWNEVASNFAQLLDNGKPTSYKGSVEVRTGLTAGGYNTLENIDPNGPLNLDSPRSKEALRVLGIKPAELIKRSIESFAGKSPELTAIQAKAYEHTRTG
jgi:hypothetical protein